MCITFSVFFCWVVIWKLKMQNGWAAVVVCGPWLSPCRDCARSSARHGVLVGVRVRQLRAARSAGGCK